MGNIGPLLAEGGAASLAGLDHCVLHFWPGGRWGLRGGAGSLGPVERLLEFGPGAF